MEAGRAFRHSRLQSLAHLVARRIDGHLEVVDARHDTWQIVVRRQRSLVRPLDNLQLRVQAREAANRQLGRAREPLQSSALGSCPLTVSQHSTCQVASKQQLTTLELQPSRRGLVAQ